MENTFTIVHWICGLGVLLSNVVVWIGVFLEGENKPKETQEMGWKLLLRGLAAEAAFGFLLFAVDAAIAREQQNKIIALEEKLAPRDLSLNAQKEISNALRPFRGTHFVLSVQGGIEPLNLLNEIEDAAKNADWLEDNPADEGLAKIERGDRSAVNLRYVSDVWVLYPDGSKTLKPAAFALARELSNKEIKTHLATPTRGTGQGDVVSIWVGAKP